MNEVNKDFDFEFELVCPDKKLIEDKAYQIVLPGDDGDFGVLANHAPVVSSLRAGVVTIYSSNDNSDAKIQKIFVSGGFVDVTSTNCKILADDAINVSELDESDLEKELQDLCEDLGLQDGEHDIAKVEGKILIVKAKLSAVVGKFIA